MTNITAAILITVTTNWTNIGEFKAKNGYSFDVLQGRLTTNHMVIFEDDGKKVEHIFKSFEGPVVGEQKNPRSITNISWYIGNYSTNTYYIR